jgi:very-short-patch-repair endonuclease
VPRIFNQQSELEKRRQLRKNSPKAEALLWARLKDRQMANAEFRRQYSVGVYVLDFYCPAHHLALELDGSRHDGEDAQEYDLIWQRTIETLGIRFLRFTNEDIYDRLEGVLALIEQALTVP